MQIELKLCKKILLAFALAGMLPLVSQAAIIQVDQNSGSETNFDGNISSTDLIQGGSATLAGSVVWTGSPNFPATGSNDGTAIHNNGLTYWGNATSADLTYTLAGSATGYDITSINTVYGWQDSRGRHAAQRYSVSVTTVSNPTFSPLHTVLYDPFNGTPDPAGSTQVTLTDSTGVLATGVTAIRFTATTDNGSEVGVIREYDVFGSATVAAVPEPSTFALTALGLLSLGFVGWRRRIR